MRFFLVAFFWLFASSYLHAQPTPPQPEVRALLQQGEAQERQSKIDEAVRFYEQARQKARERNDRAGEAAALSALGSAQMFREPQKARDHYEQALKIYEALGDKSGQALCQLNLGNAANLMSQLPRAIEHYEAALRLFRELENKSGQAAALNGLGTIQRDIGQPHKALEYYLPALQLYQEMGEKQGQLRVTINTGTAYLEMADPRRAQQEMEKALILARETGSKENEALALSALGAVQGSMGNAGKALEYLEQALPLLEATGHRSGVAVCLANIARMEVQVGNLLKSLDYTYRALDLYEAMGDRRGAARALTDIGSFYADVGLLEKARDYYQKALQANRDTGDVLGEGLILNNLGRLQGRLGRPDLEARCYEQALTLNRKGQDRENEAHTLYFLSDYQKRSGKLREALATIEQARSLYHKIGQANGEADAELLQGKLYAATGQAALVMRHYERALALYQQSQDISGEAETIYNIGAVEESQGRLAIAEQHYQRALSLLENTRASLGGLTEAKTSFLNERFPLYQRYIRLLLQTGQKGRAFEWAQKAKARTLIDLMETGRIQPGASMTARDRQEEAQLKRRDRALSQKWLAVMNSPQDRSNRKQPNRKAQEQALRQEQSQLERDWRAFRERLYLHSPASAQQRSARTISWEEAAACLPPDTALMEYILLQAGQGKQPQAEIALFVLTRKNGKPALSVYRLKTSLPSLARETSELRKSCAGRPNTAAESLYQPLAHRLYRLLITPAAPSLTGIKRLILCPDGPLWDVPFAALIGMRDEAIGMSKARKREKGKGKSQEQGTGDSEQGIGTIENRKSKIENTLPSSLIPHAFLWERYALVYAYSATGLKAALDVRRRPKRSQAQQTILVMANPNFGPVERSATPSISGSREAKAVPSRGLYERGGGLGRLPYTQVEADAIRAAFPEAVVRTEEKAQETFVKQTGGNYHYLHFATHAVFHDAAPLLSGVLLAQPDKGSPDDGILTVRELFDMPLAAELVVLSACETARGAKQRGEGIIGLTWALFVAGVPSQVVSQWAVDDAATAQLMGGFYRGLKQGKSKEEALRASALALLRDGKHRHPFYWAPFLVMGDWQ